MFLLTTTCKAKIQLRAKRRHVTFAAPSATPRAPLDEVLDAAAACFTERGFAGTTLDDVARHMGATKGRIYHYFSSKSDLMHAVRKRAMAINFAGIAPAFESDLPPCEKFREMAEAHALNMLREQVYQKALFDSLHGHLIRMPQAKDDAKMEEFIEDRRHFEDMFRVVLIAGKANGDFHFETLSYTLHTIITLLNSTLTWYRPREGEGDEKLIEIAQEIVDMACRILGVDPKSSE